MSHVVHARSVTAAVANVGLDQQLMYYPTKSASGVATRVVFTVEKQWSCRASAMTSLAPKSHVYI
jgi:hypothetical protein